MTSLYVAGKIFFFSGAKRTNEVTKMGISTGTGKIHRVVILLGCFVAGAGLVLSAEVCFPGAAVKVHPALGAEEQVADFDVVFIVGVEASNLELEDFAVSVFVSCDLSVGGFLCRIESEISTA